VRQREVGGFIVGTLIAQITTRQEHPADDLISELARLGADGRSLTDEVLLDMCFLLFIAGLDAVTSQLSVLFRHLAMHPEHQEELRRRPELIPKAVEEMLRAYPHTRLRPRRRKAEGRRHRDVVFLGREPGSVRNSSR
jgi:cytochrome P450